MTRKMLLLQSLMAFTSITVAQNVGIGTNNPAEKLHVAGNIRVDTLKPGAIKMLSNAGAGKVLTSDALGNATWQTNNPASINPLGNIGFGVWGDCTTNSIITQYQPVENLPFDAGEVFGKTVSISGNYAIIGAPQDDVGINTEPGSASIFKHDGTNWVFMQKLSDPTGAIDDQFGSSVSISGAFAIVGAPYDDINAYGNQGSASIFRFNGSSWVFMQHVIDSTGNASDNFGVSVSISGSFLIVGAKNADVGANTSQGAACVYQFNGSAWVLMDKLTSAAGQAFDNYGCSVSISGNYAIVGVIRDDIGANTDQGSAKIYQYSGGNWLFMNSLTDADGATYDNFGSSVSISGNYAIVGAPNDDVGANSQQGSAITYHYDGSNWVLMKKLTDAAGEAADLFGGSVSLSGNYAIVGANTDKVGNNPSQGSASIYLKVGSSWGKLQYITDPRGEGYNFFGYSVAIDSATQRFLIGGGVEWIGFNAANKAFFGKVY